MPPFFYTFLTISYKTITYSKAFAPYPGIVDNKQLLIEPLQYPLNQETPVLQAA